MGRTPAVFQLLMHLFILWPTSSSYLSPQSLERRKVLPIISLQSSATIVTRLESVYNTHAPARTHRRPKSWNKHVVSTRSIQFIMPRYTRMIYSGPWWNVYVVVPNILDKNNNFAIAICFFTTDSPPLGRWQTRRVGLKVGGASYICF